MSQLGESFKASTGNTSKKFRIDQNAQKIMIIRGGGADLDFSDKVLTGMPEKVSLEIQGLGSSRLSQGERIPLGAMAVFAQFGEGVITQTINGSGQYINQFIPIVLASVGVNLTAGDNSFLLLENCVPGVTYQVFAIQTPTTGNLVYNYVNQSVLGGDKHRKVDVSDVQNLVLPVKGLEKLVVYYLGGATCEYLPNELQFINSEGNDIEIFTSNAQTGVNSVNGSMTSEAIVLRTEKISQIEVFTDGNLYEYVTILEIDRSAR